MECPICLEPCEESTTTQCCKKPIHKECLDKCLSLNGACTLCRTVTVIMEPDYIVEVRVSHTINRRMIRTICVVGYGIIVTIGIIGLVAYCIVSKGYN